MSLYLTPFLAVRGDRAALAAELADLSEAALIQRYPLLSAMAALLLLLGLAADVGLLWYAWTRRARVRSRLATMPWGMYELGLLVVAYLSLNFLVLLGARFAPGDDTATWIFVLSGNATSNLALLALIGWYLHRRAVNWRNVFGLNTTPRRRGLWLGAWFFFAMIPPLYLASAVSATVLRLINVETGPQPIVELLMLTDSPWVMTLVVVLAAVVAPLFEEVMFRGVAYPAMKQRWGPGWALVIVSALFAGIHLHAGSLGPLFALGLMFALAYEVSGSLATPILMHTLFNSANLGMLLYVRLQAT